MNGIVDHQTKISTRQLTLPLPASGEVIPLEEETLCNLILDQLKGLVDYRQAVLAAVEDENLTVLAYRRPVSVA